MTESSSSHMNTAELLQEPYLARLPLERLNDFELLILYEGTCKNPQKMSTLKTTHGFKNFLWGLMPRHIKASIYLWHW